MLGLGGASTMWVSAIAGAAVMFTAGGQIIGGYKANKAREECSKVQKIIVQNALEQAQELAEAWEQRNREALALQRKLEAAQGQLRETEATIEVMASERAQEMEIAAENLSQCLLNDQTRELLNDWMVNDPSLFN